MLFKLAKPDWQIRLLAHRTRLTPYCDERLARQAKHQSHPVRDFLFQYYSYTPAKLLRWSPGPDVILEGACPSDLDWPQHFQAHADGAILPATAFPGHRWFFLQWTLDYLRAIAARPPHLGCFGLHEWAMVYRDPNIRHRTTPLRLAPEAVVDSMDLRCTHFDAYRFFTPAATPRNRVALTRDTCHEHDQPGCIHVTMDLYKFAFKLGPWCPAELMADAFELAWAARVIDMRASPYNLRTYDLSPICIETKDGRDEYVAAQRELMMRAEPIRDQLIAVYRRLAEAASGERPPASAPRQKCRC